MSLATPSAAADDAPVRSGGLLYAAWFWCVGAPLLLLTGLAVCATPGIARRRRLARAGARNLLRAIGMPLQVDGLEHLPGGACIVVANHASYLDGIVLTAALPPDFSFVIKREALAVPLLGLLLRRLRSHFVDRFDRKAARADAGRMIRSAASGHPIGIFPEGTFIAEPGLRPFRRGAFLTACRADLSVVPIGIRGTRRALGGGSWRPHRGALKVEIRAALRPCGRTLAAAESLSTAARAQVLDACGEPDRGA